MRKVIKGKLYDTDKATMVGEWHDGYPSDFHYVCETLYRKRTGEYFIHGEGGAMSRYAESCGQSQWMGGESIMPIGYQDAKEWAETHLDADEYEAEFGIPDEDAEHDLHVIVSESAWQAISRKATTDGTSVRAVIESLAATL